MTESQPSIFASMEGDADMLARTGDDASVSIERASWPTGHGTACTSASKDIESGLYATIVRLRNSTDAMKPFPKQTGFRDTPSLSTWLEAQQLGSGLIAGIRSGDGSAWGLARKVNCVKVMGIYST